MRLASPLALVGLAAGAILLRSAAEHLAAREDPLAGAARIERFARFEDEVAAVTVDYPRTDESFLCVPSKGRWVSYSAFGAPLELDALPRLVAGLSNAVGVVRSEPAEGEAAHPSYGLAPPEYVVTFHGRRVLEDDDKDVVASFEIGTTRDTSSGAVSYARHAGESTIWEIAFDPRPELERPEGSSMPPMLDDRLVPGPWPGSPESFFRYLQINGQSGEYRLVRREVEAQQGGETESEDEVAQDWSWTLEDASGSRPASRLRVETYCAFLRLAPYIGLEDPQRSALVGIERPFFSLEAWPVGGNEPLRLFIGDRAEKVAGRYCLNYTDRVLAVIPDAVASALDPARELFLDETRPEPWSFFLELATKKQNLAGEKRK